MRSNISDDIFVEGGTRSLSLTTTRGRNNEKKKVIYIQIVQNGFRLLFLLEELLIILIPKVA